MPELPEVEIVCVECEKKLRGQYFLDVNVRRFSLRKSVPNNLKDLLLDKKIISIKRKGKYLIFCLSNDSFLVIHLGMTGRLLIFDCEKTNLENDIEKNDHVIFILSSFFLFLRDPRCFSSIDFYSSALLLDKCLLDRIAPDPLEKEFNIEKIWQRINSSTMTIKDLLLDQFILSGVGNIYSCESLFLSKIHPFRRASSIKRKEFQNLIKILKSVLIRAIKLGGCSIAHYQHPDGSLGQYQEERFVYKREGEKCLFCTGKIEREKKGGRSSYFCPSCQK